MSLIKNFSLIVRPDMFTGSEYEFVPIKKLYTSLLIPSSNNHFDNLSVGSKFMFRNLIDSSKFQQSSISISKNIQINNIDYYLYNIAPGLELSSNSKLTVSYQGNTVEVTTKLSVEGAKLLIGNLILDGNYYYYYNDNDDIQIYINNYDLFGKLLNKSNKFNYYSGNGVNTILDIFDHINLNTIYHINNFDLIDKFYVRSLTTRRFMNKGSITIINKRYKRMRALVHINGVDNDYKCSYDIADILTISDLEVGKYLIKIDDNEEYINILPLS